MSDPIGPGKTEPEDHVPDSPAWAPSDRAGEAVPDAVMESEADRPGPASTPPPEPEPEPPTGRWVYRHSVPVRITHWINVLCLPILVMSGLQIFNAHPALYWGERSDRDRPILSMNSDLDETGRIRGVTTLLGHAFDTTGFLGASEDSQGQIHRRGFPGWATIPGFQWLAMGRRWHFFFAWVFVLNGLLFGLYSLLSRHLDRDLFPFLKDLRGIGRSMRDHLLFRHARGNESSRYNVLQKIAYTGVVFGLGPLILLTGMTMSPRLDSVFPGLLTLFGGRQSARTIHFIVCFAFVGFVAIHLFMVVVSGFWNNLRSMVVGRYRIEEIEVAPHDTEPN